LRGEKPASELAVTESIKLGSDTFKQLTTLNAGSIVVIGTFLKDIFPNKDGTLAVGLGLKFLISAAFVLFGGSLIVAAYGNVRFSHILETWARNPSRERELMHDVVSGRLKIAALVFFVLGIACFGTAVLINLF
jgi:hypothetical protein